MASIKSINFLPQIFRSDPNQKFIAATIDQLTSEPDFVKLSGYIGRKFSPAFKPGDTYIPEPDPLRQNYQLEPAVSVSDAKKNVTFFSSYPDLLQKIAYHGGLVNNHSRLFSSTSYNFNSLIDIDKLVNFHQYLWMPNGPPEVVVSAFSDTPVFDFRVFRDSSIPAYRLGTIKDGNPSILLTRGETYTFRVDSPNNGFFIQSKPGLNYSTEFLRLSREVLGVERNGGEAGSITFAVPLKDAQNDFGEAPSAGAVDFAVDIPYKDIQRHLVSELERLSGGIDGVGGILDGRTLIFVKRFDNASDWMDPGIFDFDPFDSDDAGDAWSGGVTAPVVDRYNIWRIRVTENYAGDKIIKLEPYQKVDPGFKVTVRQGKTYAGVEFLKNVDDNMWNLVPIITAPLNELYYQDENSDSFGGKFILRDPNDSLIDITEDVIGVKNYTSPNGIRFTNGLVVRFDNTAFPTSYRNNLFVVGGVGRAITLVGAGNYVVPEPYAAIDRLSTPDYITIDRASEDLNAWTRSNRWFHQDLLSLAAQYRQDPDLLLLAEQYQRAQRPIIEFDPNIELYSHGSNAKAMVDILDFTVTNAFKQVEGQEAFTFQLPNGKTKDVTAGMRIIFAGDEDPDVSGRIYLVQYIVTSQGSQIHLVTQDTSQISTYYVDDHVILENQKYSSIPGITYSQPYPAIGAVQAQGKVVLNTTSVQSLTAEYGGLNYINAVVGNVSVQPSIAVDTQFTQPAKFEIQYATYTYLENIHILDGGTGYTTAAVLNVPSPNLVEFITVAAPGETQFSAIQNQTVFVESLPNDFDFTGDVYLIGPGIPGGTRIVEVDPGSEDSNPAFTLSQPVTINAGVTLTTGITSMLVTENSQNSTIVKVTNSASVSAGMIVSGGKNLLNITDISTGEGANPAQVTVSSAHNLSDGDIVYITQIESGPIGINNANFYVEVISDTVFALYTDAALTAPYDATNSATYDTATPTGTVASKFTDYGLVGIKVVRVIDANTIQLNQEVTLEEDTVLTCAGVPAQGEVKVIDGAVVSVWIKNPGSGYLTDPAPVVTITNAGRTSGFDVEFRTIFADRRIDYFNITNKGTGYVIDSAITARVIDSVADSTSTETQYGTRELKFSGNSNIQYVRTGWQAWLILKNGLYADFAQIPQLDEIATGPSRLTNQYFADTENTLVPTVYTVASVDLVNNSVILTQDIDSRDNDNEEINLPADSAIFFTCKTRYFTEDGTARTKSVGYSRGGYRVISRTDYAFDAATVVSRLEMDNVLGLQVGMRIRDAGNSYGDIKILSIDAFTNSIIIDRNIAITSGTILNASSAAELAIELEPATIKEVILTESGAEYTAAPAVEVDPIKPPVLKIISSTGALTGEIIVNSLDDIDIGSVAKSEFQESGFGISTGGDVIRVLSKRQVEEAGGVISNRVTLGIARYFTNEFQLLNTTEFFLPNTIGLELGMSLDSDQGTFATTVVTEIDSGANKITLATAITAPIGSVFRFFKPVAQPVFGDVFATFTVSARIAAVIASRNITITDFNDTTPETYEVGDTVLVGTPTNVLQTAKGVPEYNQYQAVAGVNRINWVPAQKKNKINQAPRFDVFDNTGASLGNQSVYPGSKFEGTRIFSYTDGTANPDPVLGFRIKYKNFNNQGDILFSNNFYTDTFTYLNNGIETTLPLKGYDLKRFDPVAKISRRINQWEPIEADTAQYQVISYQFDNQTTYFELDILPRMATTQPTFRVYVNNKQLTDDEYSIVKVGAKLAVLIDPASIVLDAKVDIEILSDTNSSIGHYQLPVNYEINPFNSTFSEITLGQMRNHLITMSKNHYGVEGDILQGNNLRDINYASWQGSLLQHASPVLFSHLFLNDKQADAIAAIEHASKEYTRFKNRFLDMAGKTDLGLKQATLTADVDKLITAVLGGKTPRSAWYSSDMLPWGKNKTVTRLPVIDAQVRRYEIPVIFNDTELSNRAVLIYLVDPATGIRRQLIKGIDFVFEKTIPAITLADSLVTTYTSILVVEDYNTLGNYIPETPTKLGLYPKFLPRKYLDNTYQQPVNVIQGHDGSIMPAFNDFRDNLLLELELRIYNNIKTEYESGIFNHYDLVPGKWRKTGYSRSEFNQVLTKRFLKWIGANRVDYAQNKYWDEGNAWTWSYSSFIDIIDGETLPGFWRGIYMYFFDTDRPHLTPWEMLGFSERPVWWERYYGPAPYTGGNLTMWADLERGIIAHGERKGIDIRFARPGLLKLIPVDENGVLISPEKLFLASFDFTNTSGNFEIGDVGPAEAAWRKSSDFPFALQIAMALAFPGYYFGSLIDTTRYFYDTELQQYLHKDTNSRVSPSNVSVTDDGVISGTVVNTAGYINWLKDYLISKGINGTKYVQDLLSGADVTLAYRMAAFSDKRFVDVIADQSSPGSSTVNIVVPDQNYRIILNKSTPIIRAVYSAVIIEKTAIGYSVSGYDLTSPFFTIIPSIITNNAFNITVIDEIATIFNDYQPIKITVPYGFEFTNVQGMVDFLNSYQRFLFSQGFNFEEFNNELGKKQDFILSAEEFMMWAQQGWGVGTILVLSPIFDKISYTNRSGVVDSISDSLNNSKVLDQNFTLIKNSHYTVTRQDSTFTLKSLFAHTLSLVDMDIVQYEHIMLFDNVTVFNDVMYLPELGIRQQRLKLTGYKTNNWTGQLNPGGLMYNSPKIDAWRPNVNYRRGSLVQYKDKAYIATGAIPAAPTFDFTAWQISDSDQIATGMLPNWSTLADNAEKIYDVDNHPVDENLDAFSHGLIGFRERSYLTDFQLDRTTQVKFYQGYIKRKGSMNAVEALTSAKLSNIANEVKVFEDWAIRVGEYGSLGGDQYVELQLDEAGFTQNPDLVILTERDAVGTKGAINISPDEVYGYSELDYSPSVTSTRPAEERRLSDLILAGYPNVDDIDGTLFDITDVTTATDLVAQMGSGYKLWVAKDFNRNWNVYRMTETDVLVTSIDYSIGGEMTVNTDNRLELEINDVVVIKNFEPLLDGIYLVKTVSGINSFILVLDDASAAADNLRRQQTIQGTGILLKATPVRVREINEIVNDTPLYQWRDGDKVWVDNDTGTGRWAVYQKTDGWKFKDPLPLRDEDIREGESYGTSVKLNSDNQMMLVGAPAHTEGSLRGIRTISQGQDYITPQLVIDLPAKNNGQVAFISSIPLSNGAIQSATITNPGFGYQTVPSITITDEDTATFTGEYTFLPNISVKGTRTSAYVAANSNVKVSGTAGIVINDIFVGPNTTAAANVRVQAIFRKDNIIRLTSNIATIGTNANVQFARRDFRTIKVTAQNNRTRTAGDTVVQTYSLPLNDATGINVGDFFGTSALTNEVLNVFTGNNVVITKNPVSYNFGQSLIFSTQPAYVNDIITGTGISGTITVVEVTTTDNYEYTVRLNAPVPALSGNPVFKHGSGAILDPVLTATTLANVTIVSAGSGYANDPNFRVQGGGGAGAVIVPGFTTNPTTGVRSLANVTVVDAGSGFTSEPIIRVEKNSPGVTPVLAAKLSRTTISALRVISQGKGYRRPIVTIGAPESSPSGNIQATATLAVTRRSIPLTLDLDFDGTGYSRVPAVNIAETSTAFDLVSGQGAVVEAIMPTGIVRAFSRVTANSEDILQINSIKPPSQDFKEFGISLDMGYSIGAIGAPGTYQHRGVVCVAKATSGQWAITQIINHPSGGDAPANARFGEAVSMSRDENWLYIGAPGQDRVYVYAKQNPFARAVLIDYTPDTQIYFLNGLYDVQKPQELRVLGASGRVYEPGVDYLVQNSNIVFTARAGVSDRRLTVTKFFINNQFKPQIVRGAPVKVYTLESIPDNPESLFVLGASGRAFVLNKDYEIINLRQIRWLNDEFATEESFAVDAIQNYYQLIDILEPPGGNTNSKFGSSLSTNAEGYQVVVGAPKFRDTVQVVAAGNTTSPVIVVRDLKSVKVEFTGNIGNNAKVVKIDPLTNQITLDTVVDIEAGDTILFSSPQNVGRAYVYDRSYEKVLQRNTNGLRTLTVREIPRGPARVQVDRNALVKDYDYSVIGRTIRFNAPVPYAAAIKVDINNFTLIQQFDPTVAVSNGEFGRSVDITYDNLNIVISQPGYREEEYYNGAVYRYINQGLAYARIIGSAPPDLTSVSGLLKFNDNNIAFGGLELADNGLTTNLVVAAVNNANIVGLTAKGATLIFSSAAYYEYVDPSNVNLGYQLIGDNNSVKRFTINIFPDNLTQVNLITKSKPSSNGVTQQKLIRGTDFNFVYNETIASWQVVLTTGLVESNLQTQTLLVQTPVTIEITKGTNYIDLLPGTTITPNVIGVNTYVPIQTLKHPGSSSSQQYGNKVKFDSQGETLMVASKGGNTLKYTSFDKEITSIDNDTTRFIDILRGSGSVYIYDFLSMDNASPTDPALFLYNQNLSNSLIRFADNFGGAIDINKGWALIAADGFDYIDKNLYNAGAVHVFRNSKLTKSWTKLREYLDKVDIDYVNKLLLYDRKQQVTLALPDYVDPAKGKILGVADQEIDYKTSYDPAAYNIATRSGVNLDPTAPWYQAQIGRLWWNLDACRFIDYEQDSMIYRSRHWGELFPGSTIEICEWVESTVLPGAYQSAVGDGVAKYPDNSAYVSITAVDDATGLVMTKYYYWVLNKNSASTKATRKLSANTVKKFIEDPTQANSPFVAVVAPNAFNFYGFRPYLQGTDTIFRYEYSKIRSDIIAHSEYELVAEGNALSIIPQRVLDKLIDSLAGANAIGELVPDPLLIDTSQTGIQIRPRQSMFKDQQTAALIFTQYLNTYFKARPVGQFNIDQLTIQEPIPDSSFYQSTVPNYETLTYIDLNTVYDGYRILVLQDETHAGYWGVYFYRAASETWFLERIQSYDTTRYWKYVDWYASGYSASSNPDIFVRTYQDIQTIDVLQPGQLIRVNTGNSGGWELYAVNNEGTVQNVGLQNGTIEFSSLIYQNVINQVGYDAGGFDTSGYGKTIAIEIRNIVNAVIYDVFSGVASDDLDLNDFFFAMVGYILTEQKQVDWLLKTSFMSVVHKRDQLQQIVSYQRDNQSYYEDYINEVKPYRSSIKEYLLDYVNQENARMVVTDFDLPAIYDKAQNRYRVLDSDNNVDLAIIRAGEGANWLRSFSYSIQSIVIVSGGEGYIDPLCVFTSPTGSGTVAVPTATDGVITSITVEEGGTGYLDVPLVDITGSVGQGFSGIPIMGVDFATVVNGGTGYEVGDILTYTDGTGTAVFQVAKATSGVVQVVNTTSAGEFRNTTYQNVTTSTTGIGSGCRLNLVYKIVAVQVDVGGEGYITGAPRVVISGGGRGAGAKATAVVNKGSITSVILINPGSGYTAIPDVTFVGGGGAGARAYAQLAQTTGAVGSKTQNKTIRSITTKMKFDRTVYSTTVDRWKPLRTYHKNDIVVVPDNVTRTFVNLPDQILPQADNAYRVLKTLLAAEIFDNNLLTDNTLFEKLSGSDLQNTLERLGAYNRPGTPDSGRVFRSVDAKFLEPADINDKIVSVENNWNKVAVAITIAPTHQYRYAIVGNRTTMAVSIDGINWIHADLRDQGVNLRGITFVNENKWIAYGTNGTTFETENGVDWNRVLINEYRYSANADNITGQLFVNAASTIDITDATAFTSTFGNFTVVVGSRGTILMNSYGSETQVGNRWVSARVPNEIIDIQYLSITSRDFGFVGELDRVVYDGEPTAVDNAGNPTAYNLAVAQTSSGYFYIVPPNDHVGLGIPRTGFKKGFVIVAGVNGYIYFSSFQNLEDLHNGYYRGYNYDNGKNITAANNDLAPVDENYPWVRTLVPRAVSGIGDGVSGEHIADIAIGSEPDIWCVAVGSGGTLLWNVLDLFTQIRNGNLATQDTFGKNLISHSVDPFLEWREFDNDNFEYPLTKQALIDENFTSVEWDGEKFVAVTESNMIYWGYPGSKDEAFIDLSPLSQDLNINSLFPSASWSAFSNVDTVVISAPLESLSGVPVVGMTLQPPAAGWPNMIVTAVTLNGGGNNLNSTFTVKTINGTTFSDSARTLQRLTFFYGIIDDLEVGDEITFTGPLIPRTNFRETVTLKVSRPASANDNTSEIWVKGYSKVAANWQVSGAGIPPGCLVGAVGKFAAFTWKIAPGSKKSGTRSFSSVSVNLQTIELSQPLIGDLPKGTTINFFDPTGTAFAKKLVQPARAQTRFLVVENNVEILTGFSVAAIQTGLSQDGTAFYALRGNTFVESSRQYIFTGGVSRLEKDIADKVPGIAYSGVKVTGTPFNDDPTANILEWQPFTDYKRGDKIKFVGSVFTAKRDVEGTPILNDLNNWDLTPVTADDDQLDTEINSSFTDSLLGQRPEDIVVDGGKFIDTYSSHAPEELVPGAISDLLQMSVFTKDPDGSNLTVGFKIFSDQKNPAEYYRISSQATATLVSDLNYLSTQIELSSVAGLPDPNPADNRPGSVFINGEKIIYLGIDREDNKLLNIRRGASRTSIPLLHKAGSLVSDASAQQQFDADFITPILENATFDNLLGNTATYYTADVSSIQQGRLFIDLGNKE